MVGYICSRLALWLRRTHAFIGCIFYCVDRFIVGTVIRPCQLLPLFYYLYCHLFLFHLSRRTHTFGCQQHAVQKTDGMLVPLLNCMPDPCRNRDPIKPTFAGFRLSPIFFIRIRWEINNERTKFWNNKLLFIWVWSFFHI